MTIAQYEQLAIHDEHRARDSGRAAALTREAIVRLRDGRSSGRLTPTQYEKWYAALHHRLTRLTKKESGLRR